MTDTVIQVENLSKRYKIGQIKAGYGTLSEAIVSAANLPLRMLRKQRHTSTAQEFWALRDVSFQVKQGDILGIIGRNGAGKSTLLKILSRITEPSTGQVKMRGRVRSLLEVGTGFHAELTGRENIFLNGAILGMKRREVIQKFDEIVEFAEIAQFLDTPVKRYSSGMYMRLAYSIAAHLEPEILIVDEVLAVGDVSFQKKCIGKMGEVAKSGHTVIVVSHNMLSIQGLCNTALWLNAGYIADQGEPTQVIANYLRTSFSSLTYRHWDSVLEAPGNDEVRLTEACVRPADGVYTDSIDVCQTFVIEFTIHNLRAGAYLNVNVQLYNENDILIFETAPIHKNHWMGQPFPTGQFFFRCTVPGNLLNNGVHHVILFITKNDDIILHKEEDVLVFEIIDTIENRAGWYGSWDGAIRPILDWDTEFIPPVEAI